MVTGQFTEEKKGDISTYFGYDYRDMPETIVSPCWRDFVNRASAHMTEKYD